MRKVVPNIIFIIVLTLSACQKDMVSPAEYMQWMDENKSDLQSEKKIEEITYQVQYKPVEYTVLQITGTDETLDKSVFEQYMKEKEGLQYYTFRIGIPESDTDILNYKTNNESDYNKRLEYYAFMVDDDLKLIDGTDTLPCKLHHFERYYGYAPFITIDLAFERDIKKANLAKRIIYDDVVFGNGRIIMEINEDKIKNIPNIKF